MFRHSGIYIRTDAGISKPEDLRGKRIGLPEYQITAVVWMRGMLQHEYGVKPTEIHWRNGGQEQPGRDERTPLKPIPGLDLMPIGKDQTLVGMLRDGELDALFTARAPSSFLHGEPHIERLFPDTRAAEQAYYKKTGHVPDHAPGRHPARTLVEQISVACRPACTRRSARPRRWR